MIQEPHEKSVQEEKRWATVRRALAEFRKYLSNLALPLEIEPANDRKWTRPEYLLHHNRRLEGSGVYLMFDDAGTLIYVGVATVFHSRVWSHDSDGAFPVRPRRWTDIIPFERRFAFLAPALEEFLISRLSLPCHNRINRFSGDECRLPDQSPASLP